MGEYLFLYSTAYTIICLIYFGFWKKRYILDIEDKEGALRLAQWLVLYYIIDIYCLKTVPLLSRCALAGFFLSEFNFKFKGYLTHLQAVPKFKVNSSEPIKTLFFAIKILICLGALIFDIVFY